MRWVLNGSHLAWKRGYRSEEQITEKMQIRFFLNLGDTKARNLMRAQSILAHRQKSSLRYPMIVPLVMPPLLNKEQKLSQRANLLRSIHSGCSP